MGASGQYLSSVSISDLAEKCEMSVTELFGVSVLVHVDMGYIDIVCTSCLSS